MRTVLYYATPSTEQVRDAIRSGLLGAIATPAQGNRLDDLPALAFDSGCFGKGYPGDTGYLEWLARMQPLAARCRFATAPDVVGDAVATLERSGPFLPIIRALGFPAAFVAQNGLDTSTTPWGAFDVLFIGGLPECPPCDYIRPVAETRRQQCPGCGRFLADWKLGPQARELVTEARHRSIWAHMGRVNSHRRLRYADHIGCDSADGTYIRFGPDTNLPKLRGWVRAVNDQGVLWKAS